MSSNFMKDLISGGVAAAISKTICSPLEVIKLRLQNVNEIVKHGTLDGQYNGMVNCLIRIVKEEGVFTLWKGNWTNVLFYFPSQSVNFAFKSHYSQYFPHSRQDLKHNIICGSLAGVTSMLLFHPLDYVRTRLSNDAKNIKRNLPRKFKGVIDVYRQTYAISGVKGLYKGLSMSCLCMCVYRGLYFGLYDTLKIRKSFKESTLMKMLLGWGVTITAGAVAYPFDTLRRRMMMTADIKGSYRNTYDCLQEIISKEGITALYKGHGANIIRSLAGAGVLLLSDRIQLLLFKPTSKPKLR